jgi:AcrR family transcriptional regulator
MVTRTRERPSPTGERDDRRSALSREKILDAAVRVAIRDGILATTLDAVATEASVSKGGLLYHFASKDELIAAMLVHCRSKTQRVIEARMAADPNPQGRWLRALLETTCLPSADHESGALPASDTTRFFAAMLTALVNNPSLLDPVRQNMREVREQLVAEGPNGLRQVALGAAVHGLILWQHLGFISSADPVYQSILTELITLAEAPDSPIAKE